MKKGNKKLNAMLLIVCMIVTAFAVVSLPVGADVTFPDSDWRAIWDDGWMLEPQDEIIFNYDDNNGVYYTLGANGLQVDIIIADILTTTEMDGIEATISTTDAIFDITDNDDSPTAGELGGDGVMTNGETWRADFTIDLWGDRGQLPLIGEHNLLLELEYDIDPDNSEGLQDMNHIDEIPIKLIVTSIFAAPDPTAADPRDNPIPDDPLTLAPLYEKKFIVDETSGDPYLEAGEKFQEGKIDLHNYQGQPITEISANITAPASPGGVLNGITVTGNNNNALLPLGIPAGNDDDISYRFEVLSNVPPGMYDGSLEIDYTRNGKRCLETPTAVSFVVDFTPVLTASASIPDINQGDTNVTVDVTFRNTGNVPLSQLFIRVSLVSVSDGNDEYLFTPLDHYEGTTNKVTDWFEVGIGGDTLTVNEVSSAVEINKGLDTFIPAGTHKVLFDWYAYYYNTGVIGDATEYQHVVLLWEPENDGDGVEHTAGMFKDEEVPGNGIFPDDPINTGTGDILDGKPWQMGTYAMVDVVDPELSVWASIDVIDADEDVTYIELIVNLNNDENVDLINLMVTLEVGPNSPFLDPTNHAATTLAMDPSSPDSISAGSDEDITFYVDINSAWFTAGALAPGVFEVDLTIEATNSDTLEAYAPTTIQMDAPINGFGPELFATMVNYGEITPGETFTLSISIKNFGDDVAREVDAYLRADFVSAWSIVDQFTTSIGGYGGSGSASVGDASWGWETDWGGYTQFNRSHDIRPAEIGVDNVPQIVELNDWIERRETPPQGIILWLHLDRLGPGENYTFVFEMVSDVNMVEGMVYYEILELYYVDSINGETYGPHGPPMENYYTPPQEILVRAGKGEKYTSEEDFDYTFVLYALIFLIIAFIIFLIGYALGGRGGGRESKSKEPYEAYTEDYNYEPPEEEPMPEEDLGPPEPEEKPSEEEEKPLE